LVKSVEKEKTTVKLVGWGLFFLFTGGAVFSYNSKEWALFVACAIGFAFCAFVGLVLLFSEGARERISKDNEEFNMISRGDYETYALDVTRKVYYTSTHSDDYYIECGIIGVELDVLGKRLYKRTRDKLIFVLLTTDGEEKIIKHLPG